MGGNSSKSDVENFRQNVIDASVKIMQKTITYTNDETLSQANNTVTIERSTVQCPVFVISQDMVVENRVYNEMTDTQATTLKNELDAQMEDIINKTIDQSVSGLAIGTFNRSKAKSKNIVKMFMDLSSNISKETKTVFNNSVRAISEQDLKIVDSAITCVIPENRIEGDETPGFYIRQSVNLTNVMDNVVSAQKLNDIINDVEIEQSLIDTTDVSGTVEGVGLGSIIMIIVLILFSIPLLFGIMKLVRTFGSGKDSGSGSSLWTAVYVFIDIIVLVLSFVCMISIIKNKTSEEKDKFSQTRERFLMAFVAFCILYLIIRLKMFYFKKSNKKEITSEFGRRRRKRRRRSQ